MIIIFKSLSKNVIYDILDKIIREIENRLKDKKININLTKEAKDYIINSSYDEKFGARPIKRYVQRNIESLIANEIILDHIKYGHTITIDVKNDKFEII